LFRFCPDLDLTAPGFGAVGGGGRAFSEPARECRIPASGASTTSEVIKRINAMLTCKTNGELAEDKTVSFATLPYTKSSRS